MVSQPNQEENKGTSVQKSDSTTGTVVEKKIRHQEPLEALQSSSKNYEEYRHQPKIEDNLAQKDKEKTSDIEQGDSAKISRNASQAQAGTAEKHDQKSDGQRTAQT
jgi:hypothetical protein